MEPESASPGAEGPSRKGFVQVDGDWMSEALVYYCPNLTVADRSKD